MSAQWGESNVDKHSSRRRFLRSSAVALGTVAAYNVEGLSGAAQRSGSKPFASEDVKESAMPHVIVKMYPGRSEQQKRQLADAIVKDVVAIAGGSADSVSVAIEEISPAEWTEKVYKPDIQSNWDRLYKKPGYKPL
jgi:4-oxalocrotonate tautomerase